MDDPNQFHAARRFASAFAESFAETLTQRLGTPWVLKVVDGPEVGRSVDGAVNVRLTAAGGLQGDCFVTLEQAQVVAFGSKLLEQSDSALGDSPEGALVAVMGSAMEGVISSLSAQFGEVTFTVDRVEDVRLEKMLPVLLDASSEDHAGTPVLLYFDEPLLASLCPLNEGTPPVKTKRSAIDAGNLQLVMDVELNVSLRFGQCQLPLRDVLDLTSGSVIELDRDVDDPVELLLDGRVIARGEAVIVDGNYGLRVTEIPEPIAPHFVRNL